MWPQQEASYAAPAGWQDAAHWPGETACGEPQPLDESWHAPPAWENVPPAHNAGGYAPPEPWDVQQVPAFWDGEASGSPEAQAFTEHCAHAPPPLLPLAPIPAGWGGRQAHREEPAARPAQPAAAEADVFLKLLAAVGLAADRKLATPPEPSAAVVAHVEVPIPAAPAPREAPRAFAAAQETAAFEPLQPSLAQPPHPLPQFESQPASWPEPTPPQELSDDSSDAGTYSDSGADDLRDAPVAGVPHRSPFIDSCTDEVCCVASDVSERIAELGIRSGAADGLSAPAHVLAQPIAEASRAAAVSMDHTGAVAAAAPLALPAPQLPPQLPPALPVLPPTVPALLPPPFADAGPQSGLGALLAARREAETVRAEFATRVTAAV